MAQVIFPAIVVPGSTANPAEPTSPSDGQIWVDTDGTAPTTVVTRWSKTPTNGTTTLSGTDDTTNTLAYTPGYEQVFLNGVLLSRTADYTATTGTSVVLTTGTVTSDIVEIVCPLQVAYTDTITTAAAATTYVAKALTTTTGDIIYASAANTPARLGIGSSAQVLTVASGVPSWATPASSTPTFTLLNSPSGTALTGAQTVTVSGISGVNQIFVYCENASSASAQSYITLRLNTDTGNNYNYMGGLQASGYDVSGNTSFFVIGRMGTSAADFVTGSCIIQGTGGVGYKPINVNSYASGTSASGVALGGYYKGTSAITSVSIFSNTGNLDAGTIYVYGA